MRRRNNGSAARQAAKPAAGHKAARIAHAPARPGQRTNKATEIAAYLTNAIRGQVFAAGTQLPTEEALCRQFGVSRTLVREAISRMKSDGLVRSRRGSGLYVAEPFERRSFKVDDNLGTDMESVLRMLELRQPVEIAAARLAAVRRSEADLERIRHAHVALAGPEEWSVEKDLLFHLAIAAATHNTYYVDFMEVIVSVIRESIRVMREGSAAPGVDDITRQEHERILVAIENADPEAAGLSMHYHLVWARERMRRQG
jgi:GntR family transcriptional regulator, transcriptional repressor for pyruvate dehydrogenase complex